MEYVNKRKNQKMKIIKRNGEKVEYNPNKILTRIKKAGKGLKIDPFVISIEAQSLIFDGISTKDIDLQLSNVASSYIGKHPDYSMLASSLIISRIHKEFNVGSVDGWLNRVGDFLHEDVKQKALKWVDGIDYNYDFSYDFIGISTFLNSLAISDKGTVLETPIEMLLRYNLRLAETKEHFLRNMASVVNYASPILSNGGTLNTTLISCSINEVPSDSKEGIIDSLNETATQSRAGSGIGKWVGRLRSKDSFYNNGRGRASGIMKYCKMENEFTRYFKQHEKRRGKAAVYLNIWHRDILDFIEMRNPMGGEESTTRDLMTALVINDLFYKRFYSGEKWSLFCPDEVKKLMGFNLYDFHNDEFEKKYIQCEENRELSRKEISASELMTTIVGMQSKSGTPYVLNIDNANKHNAHSSFGIIKTSQLCVSGDTLILTDKGHYPIIDLVGKDVNIWNGEEWSMVKPFQTGSDKELIKVITNSGYEIDCTPQHQFYRVKYSSNGKRFRPVKYEKVDAIDLKKGDKLIKFNLPIIEGEKELKYAYTQGFYCGDGCNPKNTEKQSFIYLYDEKKKLLPYIETRGKLKTGVGITTELEDKYIIEKGNRIICKTPLDMEIDKYFVPLHNYTISSRLKWLAGLLDADGCVVDNKGSQGIQIASINKDFLKRLQLMLQTLGCDTKITSALKKGYRKLPANDGTGQLKDFLCKETYRLLMHGSTLHTLSKLGLDLKRLVISGKKTRKECSHFIKVVDVVPLKDKKDTYCFTEPKRNMGMFGGILTGNCIEILNYTDPSTSAQCCLGAIPLDRFVVNGIFDFNYLIEQTRLLSYNLNRVLDINTWATERAREGGESQRSIAIGVAGLADVFHLLKLSFDSEEARLLNSRIQEAIYYGSIKGSIEYNRKHDLKLDERLLNTELNKNGKFEWEYYDNIETTLDWESLRKDVLKYGVCNSNFIANMPTSTSGSICNINECFDPYQEIAMVRQTISGNMIVFNKHLVKELEEKGVWTDSLRNSILQNESLQGIDFNTGDIEWERDLKLRYRTIWEIPQKSLMEMAADRQKFVDHSQSMNLYWKKGSATTKILSNALYYGWKIGLVTGSYYTKVQLDNNNKKDMANKSNSVLKEKPKDSPFDCFGCSS